MRPAGILILLASLILLSSELPTLRKLHKSFQPHVLLQLRVRYPVRTVRTVLLS